MAGKMTNEAVRNLRRRQQAEEAALTVALVAAGALERAQDKRAAELARLDASVGVADAAQDVALAVLATLLPTEVVSQLCGVTAVRVRQGQQRAAVDEVAARVERLTAGAAVPKRRGRTLRDGGSRDGRLADRGGDAVVDEVAR